MRTILRRAAGLIAILGVAMALLVALAMTVLSVDTVSDQSVGIQEKAVPVSRMAATPGVFRPLNPPAVGGEQPGGSPDQPAVADFMFDKKVMRQSDWNQTQSCAGALDALTVYYSTTVTYCYTFTNIGTTTLVTHTFVDDKLPPPLAFTQSVVPNGQIGFVAVPPFGLLQDTTNTATWTATDQNGTVVERTDQVTVKVVMPLSGHVFVDQNGDGIRNPSETGGIGGAVLHLQTQPSDPQKARQTTSFPSGYYQFADAVAGPYMVSVIVPTGYVATSATQAPVTLVFGVAKVVNFGLQVVASTPTLTPTTAPSSTPTPTTGPSPTPTETAVPSPTPTQSTLSQRVYLPLVIRMASGALP